MMKICCYTCITGQYDSLKLVSGQKPGSQVDFICFADDQSLAQLDWRTKPIPEELLGLSKVKQQRILKICPHRFLKGLGYDASIWIDGSIKVLGDLEDFAAEYDLGKNPLYTRVHPQRKCIYEEAKACIALKKDSSDVIESQIERYRAEGYPKNAGMAETGVILRNHNDRRCQLVCNLWASEVLKGSHRDQLSFNYACWKMHFLPGCLKSEFSLHGSNAGKFRLCCHGR